MKITSLVKANSSIKDTEAEISYRSQVKMSFTQQKKKRYSKTCPIFREITIDGPFSLT